MKIEYAPIGIIHSPFFEPKGMPIQPSGAADVRGTVEVFEEYRPGLKDLDVFFVGQECPRQPNSRALAELYPDTSRFGIAIRYRR